MKIQHQSITYFEFHNRFPYELRYKNFMPQLKWVAGCTFKRFGNTKHCEDLDAYNRQSIKCRYAQSTTIGILVDLGNFSILKSF